MRADRIVAKNAGEILWDELQAEDGLKHPCGPAPTPKLDKAVCVICDSGQTQRSNWKYCPYCGRKLT